MKKSIFHRFTARFRKNLLYSKVLAGTGHALEGKRWIFIVGCYNSGTTLLDQMLASHPDIGGLPDEGVMLTNQLPRPEDFGWRRMWWKCEDKLTMQHAGARVGETIKRHWSHFYNSSRPFLLEKSISNTCRMPFFEREFNAPYFIHIVRNGYAVAEGIHRKAMVMESNELRPLKNYPIEYCIKQWKRSLEVVERDRLIVQNFMQIRYEDLTAEPADVADKIFSFLNLPKMRQDQLNKQYAIHQKKSTIQNMNDESISRLAATDIAIINQVAGEKLDELGYTRLSS